jgi:hypothetical protein
VRCPIQRGESLSGRRRLLIVAAQGPNSLRTALFEPGAVGRTRSPTGATIGVDATGVEGGRTGIHGRAREGIGSVRVSTSTRR